MALVNHEKGEVVFKVVYCGPAMSGKTTNLSYVHSQIDHSQRGELNFSATSADSTVSFDLYPADTVALQGYQTKFQLYTVPGHVFYDATRQLVMRGVDGLVFVADSRRDSMEENWRAFRVMEGNLARNGTSLDQLPVVLQYNKRDAGDAAPLEQLEDVLNRRERRLTSFEAVAVSGHNVIATVNAVSQLVLHRFNQIAGTPGAGNVDSPRWEAPPPPSGARSHPEGAPRPQAAGSRLETAGAASGG